MPLRRVTGRTPPWTPARFSGSRPMPPTTTAVFLALRPYARRALFAFQLKFTPLCASSTSYLVLRTYVASKLVLAFRLPTNRDGPGRASSRLPLERCDSARAGGGALPVIMSFIRSSRNPRLLQPPSAWYTHDPKKNQKKGKKGPKQTLAYRPVL